ncbi:putative dammarenediol II synthase [Helianthus annuus]|nr:putative dammarenediol II synthase [Helianthus annuus]
MKFMLKYACASNRVQEDLYYPHSIVQDLLWDSLHYLSEPILKYWPFTKLRERGLKRAVELMRYNAQVTRYITIGCVEKVLKDDHVDS